MKNGFGLVGGLRGWIAGLWLLLLGYGLGESYLCLFGNVLDGW